MNSSNEIDVRIVETLRIRIAEARNLPCRSSAMRVKEVFCSILLDDAELYRTGVSTDAQNPNFGDEFTCTVPPDFRYLSVFVCDYRNTRFQKPIGKVSFRKQDIYKISGQECWLPLRAVSLSEPQITGKIQVDISCDQADGDRSAQRVSLRIIDHSELCMPQGVGCELFALIMLFIDDYQGRALCSAVKKLRIKRRLTMVGHEASHDCVYFDLKSLFGHQDAAGVNFVEKISVRIAVWHDLFASLSAHFDGEAVLCLDLNTCRFPRSHRAWYYLQPRERTGPQTSTADDTSSPSVSCGDNNNFERSLSSLRSVGWSKNSDSSHNSLANHLHRNGSAGQTNGHSMLGQIRLKLIYSQHHVLPSECYAPLKTLLLESTLVQPIYCSPAFLLSHLSASLEEMAKPLVKIFVHNNAFNDFIRQLAADEMRRLKDPVAVFRRDSLATKCVDELIKLVGMDYLHSTLNNALDAIYAERRCVEIDPIKLAASDDIDTNRLHLIVFTERLFYDIIESFSRCPPEIVQVFSILRQVARDCFPGNNLVEYVAVSSFIFLRFFAPAIMNPKAFDIRRENPPPQVARTLTLVSKTLQRTANLAIHGKRLTVKEAYMEQVLNNFGDERHRLATRVFLDRISVSSNGLQSAPVAIVPVVCKTGVLAKRCRNRNVFRMNRSQFIYRYFCLTDRELTYSKKKDKQIINRIPVCDIVGVERVPEEACQMKYAFRIAQPTKVITLKASSSTEEIEWINQLRKLCNRTKKSGTFHPGTFSATHWTCCHQDGEKSEGCTNRMNRGETLNDARGLNENWDIDFEFEKLHQIYAKNVNRMQLMLEFCLAQEHDRDNGENDAISDRRRISFGFELAENECEMMAITLQAILQTTGEICEATKQYLRRRLKQVPYGSQKVPIGDDNYLILCARVKNFGQSLNFDDHKKNGAAYCNDQK